MRYDIEIQPRNELTDHFFTRRESVGRCRGAPWVHSGVEHLSLYVRVELSFYTHRKTLRLKSIIGNDAFWVPPRLWAYAAGNQPDGDFTDYTPEEISSLIGYSNDAKALLQALLKTGFMDANPLRIHDWHEYNGILDFFSKRAKKAAEVRWAKERSKEKKRITAKQIRSEHSIAEPSIASSIKTPRTAFKIPSISEIKLQASKIGCSDREAEKFLAHFESNGWRVGSNPMRSWSAALQKWHLNGSKYGATPEPQTPQLLNIKVL